MRIDLKNSLLGGLIAALTAVAFVTQAAPGKSQGSGGWEPSADHLESVVVSIKSSPLMEEEQEGETVLVADEEGTEAACVAVQIGMNLLMSELKNCLGETTAVVTPADEVLLFLTLGGVTAVGPDIGAVEPAPMCTTPCGPVPLTALIDNFAGMEGSEVIVCPLCWNTRYGPCTDEEGAVCPTHGEVADGVGIHDLFLYADKVIDF